MLDDPDRCPYDRGSADDVRSAFDRLSPELGSDALPLTHLAERRGVTIMKRVFAGRHVDARCPEV
jgi:hypothetical protein